MLYTYPSKQKGEPFMRHLFIVAFMTVMSTATVYSQPSEKGNAKKYVSINVLGKQVLVDGEGSFIHRSSDGYIVKGTYDVNSKTMSSAMYYNASGTAINGKMTLCTQVRRVGAEAPSVPYGSSTYVAQEKKVTTAYYDATGSIQEYTDICGDYGEITQYTFVDGILEGPYSYRYKVHGGNVDRTELTTGAYKNNQKHGQWMYEVMMDCAGTMDTWFDWINGSYHTITKTNYADGEIVYGPITAEVE
jgi:hypothetical protein